MSNGHKRNRRPVQHEIMVSLKNSSERRILAVMQQYNYIYCNYNIGLEFMNFCSLSLFIVINGEVQELSLFL